MNDRTPASGGPTLATKGKVISREVRRKLNREQRRVLALLHDLRAAVEAGDPVGLAERATNLEESLDAHLSFVAYVVESLAEDDPSNETPRRRGA